MADQAQQTSPGKRIMGWIGTISAIIGFGASIAGGVRWYENRRQHQAERAVQIALADSQRNQGEYLASVLSDDAILKDNPLDPVALQQQLETTMEWVENFRAIGDDGQSGAGPQLDQIMTILNAGLASSQSAASANKHADIQAHLGWAHWLNQKIANREYGATAEQDLRAALKLDPGNVYANTMLGNWLLQNSGDRSEAIKYFHTADSSGMARPFVRTFEIAALAQDDALLQPELFKTANAMRQNSEPLDAGHRKRILYFCLNPPFTSQDALVASLSAVPRDDAWQTYLWLIDGTQPNPPQITRAFIHATLIAISGDKTASLQEFRSLQQESKTSMSPLQGPIDDAIRRLTQK